MIDLWMLKLSNKNLDSFRFFSVYIGPVLKKIEIGIDNFYIELKNNVLYISIRDNPYTLLFKCQIDLEKEINFWLDINNNKILKSSYEKSQKRIEKYLKYKSFI